MGIKISFVFLFLIFFLYQISECIFRRRKQPSFGLGLKHKKSNKQEKIQIYFHIYLCKLFFRCILILKIC